MARQTQEYCYSHKLARDSTSEYAAPITLVPKPDGTWRLCVDYRKLNSITHEAKYPLPRVEDCLDQLRGVQLARQAGQLHSPAGGGSVATAVDAVLRAAA